MSTSTVARLLGLGLTPGKLYALQQISNPNGTLTMLAIDQNNSIVRMARSGPLKHRSYSSRDPGSRSKGRESRTTRNRRATGRRTRLITRQAVGIRDTFSFWCVFQL